MHSDFDAHDGVLDGAPSFTLHPVRGVVWAAFWGTVFAAGVILALNYSRMGKRFAAQTTIAVAVVATISLFALTFSIPDEMGILNVLLGIAQLLAVYIVASRLQGDEIHKHSAKGGDVASAWAAIGIALLCLPFLLGAVVGVSLLLEPSYGTVVEFGNDEVYYLGDATEEDARSLAEVLRDIEIFGAGGSSARLELVSGQYKVSFIVDDYAWHDPETVEAFSDIGRHLADEAFSPLEILLCDEYFAPQETIAIP